MERRLGQQPIRRRPLLGVQPERFDKSVVGRRVFHRENFRRGRRARLLAILVHDEGDDAAQP